MHGILEGQLATNVISLLVLAVTAIYVGLTWKIARGNSTLIKVMNEQFQETVRPNLVVNIKVRVAQLICIQIENMGRSSAHNVTLRIDRDFFQFAEPQPERNLRHFQAFSQPMQSFAPGERLRFDLAQGFKFDHEVNGVNITPSRFEIHAGYSSLSKRYDEVFGIDIAPYMHTNWTKTADESLQDIESHISKLVKQ